jgi:signal transduction histidine kinase
MQALHRSLEDKDVPYNLEHRLRHKDGTYRWILARGVVRRDDEGRPLRMAGSHVDITEQKVAAHQLEETNRMLIAARKRMDEAEKIEFVSILAGGIAHEIRNPLQILLGGTNYLSTRFRSPDAPLEMVLSDMHDAIRRASKIVRSIEPENGLISCVEEDLNLVVEEALRLVKKDVRRTGVRVCLNLSPGLPAVCVDSDRMSEVFINLILNALYAMPEGGTLTLRTYALPRGAGPMPAVVREMGEDSDVVVAEVQDTGIGIRPEDLEHVFDLFWSRRPCGRGSGLGLPVCRKIVDLHHGAIELSNAEPRGVLATVVLPTAVAASGWCQYERKQK